MSGNTLRTCAEAEAEKGEVPQAPGATTGVQQRTVEILGPQEKWLQLDDKYILILPPHQMIGEVERTFDGQAGGFSGLENELNRLFNTTPEALTGYALFQRVMRYVFEFHFPEWTNIGEDKARTLGIYPTYWEHNHTTLQNLAGRHNGHLADLAPNIEIQGDISDEARLGRIFQKPAGELTAILEAAKVRVTKIRQNQGKKDYHPNNAEVLGFLGIPTRVDGGAVCIALGTQTATDGIRCRIFYPKEAGWGIELILPEKHDYNGIIVMNTPEL